MEPQLLPWFNAVDQDATQFSILACPWQDLAAISFPNPILGLLSVTIVDEHVLTQLQDMGHGLGWRLNCDRILSTGKPVDRGHFAPYLQRGSEVVNNTTIYGAAVLGQFFPTFVYLFLVHNGWPMQNDVLGNFGLPLDVSLAARDYLLNETYSFDLLTVAL